MICFPSYKFQGKPINSEDSSVGKSSNDGDENLITPRKEDLSTPRKEDLTTPRKGSNGQETPDI